MTRAQEKLGRALARAIRSLEFDTKLTDGEPSDASVGAESVSGPRVEIRYPRIEYRGVHHLVAIIALEPVPTITYAAPAYRRTIELVLRRVISARAA